MPRTPKSPDEIRIQITGMVLPAMEAEIGSIAIKEDRTKSKVVEKLVLRGLAAYRRDGSLDEPVIQITNENAIQQDDLREVKRAAPRAERVRKAR